MVKKNSQNDVKCTVCYFESGIFYVGVRSSDPAEIAKAMFKAMRKFNPETLHTVRVIIFQRDMVSVFLSTLKTLPQGIFTQAKDFISGKYKGITYS